MTLQFLYPELIIFVIALSLLIAGLNASVKKFIGMAALFAVVLALFALPSASVASTDLFFHLLQGDKISLIFRVLILVATAFIILISMADQEIQVEDRGEYFFFILCMAIAMMLAVSSSNLMMIYIALETTSILSYILAGFFKNDNFSSEAGLKYFLFGALSTGIMLYGVSLIYGLTGTLSIPAISHAVSLGAVHIPTLVLSLIFVFVGIAFKCSLVPFHMAAPDVYQGAPTPVSVFLSIGPKAMGFALLLRLFVTQATPILPQWSVLAQVLAVLTMTIGNFIALKQTNVKRMLAYSSIAHAGFILIALTMGGTIGIKALVFYLFIYIFMNVGAFGCVILTNRVEISQYAGLSKQNPLAAALMTVSLLSLAGLPPLAGFMAKFLVIAAAVEAKLYALAIIAVLNSVVALFYYLRIVKAMYLSSEEKTLPIFMSKILVFALLVTFMANLVFGIWPGILIPNPLF